MSRPRPPTRRRAPVAPSCRRARRRDRPRACPPRRRAVAPAAMPRRPAPTTRRRRSRAAPRCGPSGASRTLPVGSTRPASRSAHSSGSLLTVRSSGGSTRCISAMARARCSPQYDTQRDHSQSGVLIRAASSFGGDGFALARHATQHRIGELVVALGLRVVLRERHGEVDGRVRRRLEKNELRRRRQQNGIERARSLRQTALEKACRARDRADLCA